MKRPVVMHTSCGVTKAIKHSLNRKAAIKIEKSQFFEEVYKIVETIAKGNVITYGKIAKRLNEPEKSRYVGYAMRMAPDSRNLPCHRVVNGKGEVQGERMEKLLDDGITFDLNGRVNKIHFI